MTSENNLNTNKDVTINGEEKVSLEEEESSTTIDTKNVKEPAVDSIEETLPIDEGKQMNGEKFDNADEKKEKRDVSSNSENETTADDDMDTQPLFEQPIVLEGKRSRKPTLRLEILESLPTKKELSIPQGHGKPLGEIEYINHQITHASSDTLSRMRYVCFGRRGNKANIRKNLREFKGFEFKRQSDEYEKHLSNLIKFKKDELRSISNVLGLPSTGRNTDHAERILNFLVEPIDEGKRIPKRKSTVRSTKKRTKTSKQSVNTDQENDKSSNKTIKRKKDTSTKSKAKSEEIVNENDTTDDNKQIEANNENEIRSLLDNLQFQLYNKLLLDHEVTNDPQRFYCPHVDCGHILIISHKRSMTCTKCQTKICLKCRCQWHPNERCSNLLKLCEMKIHENIKYCPRCHFLLERVAGCAQIICANCKHTFCWYCLKSLNNDFFLLHFERGPCRNRLGHSRLSLFLHRLMMLSLIVLFIILLIICAPLLILLAPLLICFRYKQLKTYFNKLMKWEQPLPTTHQSSDHIEQSTRNPLIVSSLDIDKSLPIYDV
ncbi:unnamed protein product [Adineta steineri]|uniref:RING-type domain-containing protein n=1 Tax=Adineta steineri TaxID=433720 RepID=A0A819YMI4_9BILA|nr:unnamed protein product [Adineta steineri]